MADRSLIGWGGEHPEGVALKSHVVAGAHNVEPTLRDDTNLTV